MYRCYDIGYERYAYPSHVNCEYISSINRYKIDSRNSVVYVTGDLEEYIEVIKLLNDTNRNKDDFIRPYEKKVGCYFVNFDASKYSDCYGTPKMCIISIPLDISAFLVMVKKKEFLSLYKKFVNIYLIFNDILPIDIINLIVEYTAQYHLDDKENLVPLH